MTTRKSTNPQVRWLRRPRRSRSNSWPLMTVIQVVVLAIVLAACTTAEDGDTPATDTTAPAATDTTAPAATDPGDDGEPRTLFIADVIDIAPIDPSTYSHTITRTMIRNVYDPLVYYELGGFDIEPRLATSWEASDDGLEYTFQLREGVLFHNGEPFTAYDVQATFERLEAIGENVPLASLGGSVKAVEVVDDFTVKFTLNFPYAFFVDVLPKVPIISQSDIETYSTDDDPWATAWFSENANGTGPYSFASWTPGETYTLHRNVDWFGGFPENAYDRVVMRLITDGAQQRQLLEQGDLDLASDWIGAVDKIAAAESSDRVKLVESDGLMVLLMMVHGDREFTDNVLVRRALKAAFPYAAFESFYGGFAKPPTGVFADSYPNVRQRPPLVQDLDLARELLAKAGYPDGGFTLRFDFEVGVEEKNQAALLFQAALAELGIALEINPIPGGTYVEQSRNPETSANFNAHFEAPETPDPFQWITKMFAQDGYLNQHFRSPQELNDIMAAAQVELDAEARAGLLNEAVDIIENEVMGIPISKFSNLQAMSVCVEGFVFDQLDLQGVPKFWVLHEAPECG